MPRICLISPGHLSTNPRLVKEAGALAQAGYTVHVISARYSRWGEQADHSCVSSSWRWEQALPFGPLAPWLVRVRQAVVMRAALLLWRMGVRHHSVAAAAWHPLCCDLIRQARSIAADLYIAHYPAALPAAALAARHHRARYGFDAEDFHPGDWPEDSRFTLQRRLLRAIESQWLPGCAFLTAASPGIAEAYAATYGLPSPTVVRNVFSLAQAPPSPTPCGTVSPGPSLYWFSQTIGPDRGLECAVRALTLAHCKPHLHLRGFLRPAYRAQLFGLARELGVEEYVHVHPPAPPEQMEQLAASYDVGLVAESGCTHNRRIALTNKLFTYVLAGIPIMLSDIPAHRQLQGEAGEVVRLFRTEDPASLAAAIDGLLDAPPAVLEAARAAAFRLGQNCWNWEREQVQLLQCVQAVFRECSPAQALANSGGNQS